MKREMSFRERLDAGATKEELMKYYALSEVQYQRVLVSLAKIQEKQVKLDTKRGIISLKKLGRRSVLWRVGMVSSR